MDVPFKQLNLQEQIAHTLQRGSEGDYSGLRSLSELYDPRVNQNTDKFLPALKVKGFLSFLLIALPQYPLECLLLLRHYARKEGMEHQINSLAGIRIITDTMKKNLDKLQIIENSCIVLGLLTTDEDIRKKLTEQGTVKLLTDVLNNYIHNSRIVVFICKVLNNACYKLGENKIAFIESGGYSKLIWILSSDIETKTKIYAALLLRTICNLDEDRTFLLDTVHNAIEDFIKIFQSDSIDIQTHLLWATLNLTINSGSIKRQFGEKGGISKLLEIIQHYQSNDIFQQLACTLLLQLSRKQYNRIAIGKGGGITQIVHSIKTHKLNKDLLEIALTLIDILCGQGINRKRLTKEKGLLADVMNALKENLSVQHLVNSVLNIIYKIASGANQSKYELRAANVLPLITEVITTYTSNQEIRNLANNCISEIFKPSQVDEEDSNETYSSEESDSSSDTDTPTESTSNNIPKDIPKSVVLTPRTPDKNHTTVSPAVLPPASRSHPIIENPILSSKVATVDQKISLMDSLNIREDLMNERNARKKLEDEVINLKKKLKDSEFNVEQHLDAISQNQTLSTDLEMSQQHISELILEVQTCQTEMEAERIKQEMEFKERERNLIKEIAQLKQNLEDKDKIIERLKQPSQPSSSSPSSASSESPQPTLDSTTTHNSNSNSNSNLVEDFFLFEWMTVAIRLDLTMHRQNIITHFDKNSLYDKLKEEKVDHSSWPKTISSAMINTAAKNASSHSPKSSFQKQQKNRKKK